MRNRKLAGALPDHQILKLIEQGYVLGANPDPSANVIQPASLDLTVGRRIFKIKGVILPQRNEHMQHYRKRIGAEEASFDDPLEVNCVYLVELTESLRLPRSVYGYVNPKSSTGRIDLHVRLLANELDFFDGVEPGYEGALWVIVIPKSFRVKLHPGVSLNQMRFFTEDTRFTHSKLQQVYRTCPLVWDMGMNFPIPVDQVLGHSKDGKVVLHADIRSGVAGWRAKKTEEVIDLSRKDHDPNLFWEAAVPEDDMLFLEQGSFWILSTMEGIVVPPGYAAEVVAMDERFMEARTHYAGFFDPGWGYRKKGRMGDTATMEVRPYESMFLRHGLPLAAFRFEEMLEVPTRLYGADSHYGGQLGPGLAKFFAKPESV